MENTCRGKPAMQKQKNSGEKSRGSKTRPEVKVACGSEDPRLQRLGQPQDGGIKPPIQDVRYGSACGPIERSATTQAETRRGNKKPASGRNRRG